MKSVRNECKNKVSDTQHMVKVSITAVYMREKWSYRQFESIEKNQL